MISGVPAAAIRPMKAILVPMLAMLLKLRNHFDRVVKMMMSTA